MIPAARRQASRIFSDHNRRPVQLLHRYIFAAYPRHQCVGPTFRSSADSSHCWLHDTGCRTDIAGWPLRACLDRMRTFYFRGQRPLLLSRDRTHMCRGSSNGCYNCPSPERSAGLVSHKHHPHCGSHGDPSHLHAVLARNDRHALAAGGLLAARTQ